MGARRLLAKPSRMLRFRPSRVELSLGAFSRYDAIVIVEPLDYPIGQGTDSIERPRF